MARHSARCLERRWLRLQFIGFAVSAGTGAGGLAGPRGGRIGCCIFPALAHMRHLFLRRILPAKCAAIACAFEYIRYRFGNKPSANACRTLRQKKDGRISAVTGGLPPMVKREMHDVSIGAVPQTRILLKMCQPNRTFSFRPMLH